MKIDNYYEAKKDIEETTESCGFVSGHIYKIENIKGTTVYFVEYENEDDISVFYSDIDKFDDYFKKTEVPEIAEEEGEVRGKRGRPKKSISEATNGKLAAGLERSIQSIEKMRTLKVLNDDEIKERFRRILDRCLELMEQHFSAMDITTVTFVKTPNGPKKITMGGFNKEDYEALMGTVELISEILVGKIAMPENSKDQKMLIRQYLKPLVAPPKEDEIEQ